MPVIVPTVGLCAVPFLLAAGLAACSDESQPASYELPRGADRLIVELTTELIFQGERVLTIQADSAFFHEGSDVVHLTGVQGKSFSATGVPAVTLQADSGSFESDNEGFTAMGDVILRRSDGTVSVRTSELVFDPATGRLISDSPTEVEARGSSRSGNCFETDAQLAQWSMCGGSP